MSDVNWEYRVVRRITENDSDWYSVEEIYFDEDGSPMALTIDPQRQEGAAEVIRDFAEGKQVILFTCHPAHAKLLGGRTIELNSTVKKGK